MTSDTVTCPFHLPLLLHLLEVGRRLGSRDDGGGEEVGRGRTLRRKLVEELEVAAQPTPLRLVVVMMVRVVSPAATAAAAAAAAAAASTAPLLLRVSTAQLGLGLLLVVAADAATAFGVGGLRGSCNVWVRRRVREVATEELEVRGGGGGRRRRRR